MPSTSTSVLDGLSTSVAVKPPCIAVTSAHITLDGLQIVGGVDLYEGQRVLVKDQNDAVDNGIYVANSGQWQRAKDFDGNRDVVQGTLVLVRNASADGAIYEVTSANPVVIDTSEITLELRDDPAVTYAQTQAEIDASVLALSGSYQPLNPWRYAADGASGAADDTALARVRAVMTAATGIDQWKNGLSVPGIPQTVAEATADYIPSSFYITNWAPTPDRFGAAGDGVTNDTGALMKWATVSKYLELGDKSYLTTGITISTEIRRIVGNGENSKIKITNALGAFGLKFIHSSGNSTHFVARLLLRDFQINCEAGSQKIYGIWMDNAELRYMQSVYIDLSGNTHAGVERDSTFAFYGRYQQDGTFNNCSFTGGSGTYSDGLYLRRIDASSLPNSNIFTSCRAQSCGGWGVRHEGGVGNMWIGGKVQSNTNGGWLEADDGSGNGSVGTCLYGLGFEHNGNAGGGHDLRLQNARGFALRDASFQTPLATNAAAIYADAALECVFDNNFCYDGNAVIFAAGTSADNEWHENNRGFGTVTITEDDSFRDGHGYTTLTYGASITPDVAYGEFFRIFVTDGSAFTIQNPSNRKVGKIITFDIFNNTGGTVGTITWGAQYQLAGAFTNPANTKRKTISFRCSGTQWIEICRASADI